MGDDTRERDGTSEGSASDRDEPPIRFRGDEPDLYLAYNHVLNGLIRRDVGAAPEDIEDACQFAWIQFFRYQPDRDRNWRAWLYRTAQREAWRLTAVRRSEVRIEPDPAARGRGTTEEPADPRDRLDERVEFLAAMQELSRLSIRMQQTVIVRSQVRKQIEVAEILGRHHRARQLSPAAGEREARRDGDAPQRAGAARCFSASGATARTRGRPAEMADRSDRSRAVAQQDVGLRRPRLASRGTRDR